MATFSKTDHADKPREAEKLARGRTRILHSGDWIAIAQLVKLAQVETVEYLAELDKWKLSGEIFVLRNDAVDYVPMYGLDPLSGYRPYSELSVIINSLASKKDSWGMAFWFGSSCSFLGGCMPKDLFRHAPEMVLQAAKDEVCGIVHG